MGCAVMKLLYNCWPTAVGASRPNFLGALMTLHERWIIGKEFHNEGASHRLRVIYVCRGETASSAYNDTTKSS